MFKDQTWWIIGASEGLGRALAHLLDGEGADLLVSARNADRLNALAGELGKARAIPMDVSDPVSVRDACAAAGPVDGVIYCVGQYVPMAAADWQPGEAEQMAEANFMGALRVLGHVVPEMVRRDQGRIMLIGSLSGYRGLPGAIGYGASKAALMHLGENLYGDLKGTGVRVQLANPGFIRTRLTDKNDFRMPMIMEPERAADHVLRALKSGRFSTSFPAPFAWVFTLAHLVPRRLYYWLLG